MKIISCVGTCYAVIAVHEHHFFQLIATRPPIYKFERELTVFNIFRPIVFLFSWERVSLIIFTDIFFRPPYYKLLCASVLKP